MRLRRLLKNREDLFANLPSEIIIDILSRLPIRTIISCKFVCKSWLSLLNTHEFVNSHLLKPVVGLVLVEKDPFLHTIYEFEDGLDVENTKLRCSSVIKFHIPFICECIGFSANGLLLQYCLQPLTLQISNPITREYITIDPPELLSRLAALGFGATKISGQHKVVTIFQDKIPSSECNCYLYTLGTRVWKKIACGITGYLNYCIGVFMNDNLHWLVSDSKEASHAWISCLDLENERFSTFSFPVMAMAVRNKNELRFGALRDTLCLYYNRNNLTTVIWLMEEYGVEKSWTKQFVIFNSPSDEIFRPIKVFKDGDILIVWNPDIFLLYYSKKNKILRSINVKFESRANGRPYLHVPNFLSLKRFAKENVLSF